MKNINEYFIKSINEFNDILTDIENKKYREVFYRGQTDDFPLIPSIGRTPTTRKKQEKDLFEEFKRLNKLYPEINTSDDWDLLAIAQHYGLKTRLLDWTINPLNSLWFACNTYSSINYKDDYCVVWIIANIMKDEDFYFNPENDKIFEIEHTMIFKPNHQALRIKNQQGLFTIHKENETFLEKANSFYMALELDEKFTKNQNWDIIKILVNRKKFAKEFISKLNTFGINESTIYPELEGLSKHLNWLHVR